MDRARRKAWLVAMGLAVSGAHAGEYATVSEAERVLRESLGFIPCAAGHFIYGVGATDGSYVERVFYTADSGPGPAVRARFRDPLPESGPMEEETPPLRFELQLEVARAWHATPRGEGWVVARTGWETSLRFKYTNWFGTISRRGSAWHIDWQGYRRPLLPEALLEDPRAACGLFEATDGTLPDLAAEPVNQNG